MDPAGSRLAIAIAGAVLEFRCAPPDRIEPPRREYADFLLRGVPERSLVTEVRVSARPPPDLQGRTLFDAGNAWSMVRRGGQEWIVQSAGGTGSRPLWAARTEPDSRRIDLYCSDRLWVGTEAGKRFRHVVQYPLDQILLVNTPAFRARLLIHCAALLVRGSVLLLAGPSGAGKSTLARRLMAGGRHAVLSDDRAVVRTDCEGCPVFGTPWPGEARMCRNRNGPLGGVWMLRHGPRTRLRELTPREALPALLRVVSIPWYDPERIGRALDSCEALLAACPFYELEFCREAAGLEAALESCELAA